MVRQITFKEAAMRKTGPVIFVAIIMMLSILPGLGHAADELFDTEGAAALMNKGVSDLMLGHYNAAIEALEESVGIDPQAPAFYYLGYAYYMKSKKGDGENRTKAMENFDKAYELDPGFTPIKIKAEEPAAAPAPSSITTPQTK
jgi:tetratricopeptide (TPR) repeat protein